MPKIYKLHSHFMDIKRQFLFFFAEQNKRISQHYKTNRGPYTQSEFAHTVRTSFNNNKKKILNSIKPQT